MTEYTALSDYLKLRFGCKVYKLSLTCSNTCPNRDGNCGSGGCIFCAEGSGNFAPQYGTPIERQLTLAKERVAKKIKNGKYIAYFQSYTSTYGDTEYIRDCLIKAADSPDIVAVSVATRPDCLSPEIMEILKDVLQRKPLWVELGLQTAHDETAKLINRGYGFDCFADAVSKLKEIGAEIIVHVILGLPQETESMMLETVKRVTALNVNGIKFQLLHILKGTRLYEMYKNGEVEPMSEDGYYSLVEKCVKLLPPDIVVHRLTGDGDKRLLIAPMWSADKRKVINNFKKILRPRSENEIIV